MRSVLRVIVITGLLLAATPGVARGAAWQWPVSGRVVGSFSLSPDAPFAAGRHRGIAIAAPAGTPILSACPGRVAFAGAVGRAGPTVSVICGALRATYQGLDAIRVRAGQRVSAGDELARLAPAGRLKLGARVESDGRGLARYVDPATLLADDAPPLGPAPPARAERPRPVMPHPLAAHRRAPMPPEPSTPLLAWLGLVVLAAGAPVGALTRRRRRHRAVRAAVQVR